MPHILRKKSSTLNSSFSLSDHWNGSEQRDLRGHMFKTEALSWTWILYYMHRVKFPQLQITHLGLLGEKRNKFIFYYSHEIGRSLLQSWYMLCSCWVAKSRPTLLFMTPWTIYSLPGFSVYGIIQGSILEWVAISFSRRSSQPRDQTLVSCFAGWFFTTEPPGKLWYIL